jgi:transcriptional regulator with XRE-family HTH domain
MSTENGNTGRPASVPGGANQGRRALGDIGRRIVRLRQRRGWPQAELAERLGVSRERLGSWERGRCLPALDGLLALRQVLGVSIDELLTGEPSAGLQPGRQDEARGHLAALAEILGGAGTSPQLLS